MDYFPFSLPFDLYNTFRVISGSVPTQTLGMTRSEVSDLMAMSYYIEIDPHFTLTPPRFEIEVPAPFYYTFIFDMADYEGLIAVIRWSLLIMFAFALYKITPLLIRW